MRAEGRSKHVVYVQFDNTRLRRDDADVPSDLEQIPALKSFLQTNGVLSSNEHTILISHAAGGIISSLTGLYPSDNGITAVQPERVDRRLPVRVQLLDRSGQPLGPRCRTSSRRAATTRRRRGFRSRAGCDVGAFSIASMELEAKVAERAAEKKASR